MALAGILSFSDKIIDSKLANEIRRCLSMTKVGAIIAREMEESEERGRAEGRASALLTVLAVKGEVPERLEKKIMEQTKSDTLDQWLKIAVAVPDPGAFEEQIAH